MNILKMMDLFVIRHILEPNLHEYQRRTGRDNLLVEEFVTDCMGIIFITYSICIIIFTKEIVFGTSLLVCSGAFLVIFSASLYEKLSKGEKKHPMRIKAEDVRQKALDGVRNPLEYMVANARIFLSIELLSFVLCSVVVFSILPEIMIYVNTIIIFLSCFILSIYIGACTPLPQQTVKDKQKKPRAQLASAES